MVHKIEAACKLVGLDFLGWAMIPQEDEMILRLQKGEIKKDVRMPLNTFNMMGVESLSLKIKGLFVGNPTCL